MVVVVIQGQPRFGYGPLNASQLANCSLQEIMAAPRKIETSVDELWVEELQPAQKPSSSLNTISSDLSAMSLAQHACANIQHKAFIGMFVPHNRLLQILEGLSLFPSDALRHTKQGSTMSKLTNKRPRGN